MYTMLSFFLQFSTNLSHFLGTQCEHKNNEDYFTGGRSHRKTNQNDVAEYQQEHKVHNLERSRKLH